MLNKIIIVIALLLLTACKEKNLSVSPQVSDSGIPYTLVNMPGNSRVSIQLAWPNRWTINAEKNQATPRIATELILAGGAEGYGAGQVVEEFSDMNSEGYLSTSPDYVIGTLHYSPEYAEKTLEIANAHLKAPALDERWFKRIQDQLTAVAEEVAVAPGAMAFEALRIKILDDHPVRLSLNGTNPELVQGVSINSVREWVESVIVRKGVTIVIAGDLNADSASEAIDALFEGLPEGGGPSSLTFSGNYSPTRMLFHAPESTTSLLSFIGPLPPTKDGGEFEDAILLSQLRGIDGVLNDAVRTKLRASYHYAAGIDAFARSHRVLVLTGEIETSKLSAAEKIIRQAYSKFLASDNTPDISALKAEYSDNLKTMAEDTGSTAFSALMAKLDGFEGARVLQLLDELNSVSEESVLQRKRTAFPEESELVMIVSSPDKSVVADACVVTDPLDAVDC